MMTVPTPPKPSGAEGNGPTATPAIGPSLSDILMATAIQRDLNQKQAANDQGVNRPLLDEKGRVDIKQGERPIYPNPKGDEEPGIEGPLKLTPGTTIDPRAIGRQGG